MEKLDIKQKKKTLNKISRIKQKTDANAKKNTNYFLFIHKIEPNVERENQYESESIDSVNSNIVDV